MSFKRPIMIGAAVVVTGLLATLAYAGWGGCCGYLYTGSLHFHWILEGGAKPDVTSVESIGLIKEVAITCKNHGGNYATAWAPTEALVGVHTDISSVVENNGYYVVDGTFPDSWEPENPVSYCPNQQNWTVEGPVVASTVVWTISVQTELKNQTKYWDTQVYNCTYQGPYPAPEGGDSTPQDDYDCVLQSP